MRICVISASPKGEASITFHTVLWIMKNHQGDEFETFHIGKSRRLWEDAYKSMTEADMVLFCYPVYTFIAPAMLHEFMAMIKERGGLDGKSYAQVTTSKHFYDTTAYEWSYAAAPDCASAHDNADGSQTPTQPSTTNDPQPVILSESGVETCSKCTLWAC